ncbi:hypothetical protein HDU67_004893 [Dinochytrium kinnereticum]|nr:hypothetical protein HDU67_004893 [Dinochytrium kinnereticum]
MLAAFYDESGGVKTIKYVRWMPGFEFYCIPCLEEKDLAKMKGLELHAAGVAVLYRNR